MSSKYLSETLTPGCFATNQHGEDVRLVTICSECNGGRIWIVEKPDETLGLEYEYNLHDPYYYGN